MLVITRMLLLSLYFSFSTSRSSPLMLGTGISKATALCPRLAIFPVNNAMNSLGITGHYPIHSLTLVHKGPVFKPKTSGGSRASKPTCHNHLEPYFCPVCACSNRVLLYTMPGCLPLPRKSLGIPTQMRASVLLLLASSTALHKELQYRTYHMVSIYSTPSRMIISTALK